MTSSAQDIATETAVVEVIRTLHARFDSLEAYHRDQGREISNLQLRMEVLERVATHHEDKDSHVHEQHRASIERVEKKVDDNHASVKDEFTKMEATLKEDRKEAASFREQFTKGHNHIMFVVIVTLLGVVGTLAYEFIVKPMAG